MTATTTERAPARDISGGRELRDDLRPVGVHFVSQNHRQGSVHSLTELQPVHRDEDLAIGPDLDEGVRRVVLCHSLIVG